MIVIRSLYINDIYFDARDEALPSLDSQAVKTSGQIGTRIVVICDSPFCVFVVDTPATINKSVFTYPIFQGYRL